MQCSRQGTRRTENGGTNELRTDRDSTEHEHEQANPVQSSRVGVEHEQRAQAATRISRAMSSAADSTDSSLRALRLPLHIFISNTCRAGGQGQTMGAGCEMGARRRHLISPNANMLNFNLCSRPRKLLFSKWLFIYTEFAKKPSIDAFYNSGGNLYTTQYLRKQSKASSVAPLAL